MYETSLLQLERHCEVYYSELKKPTDRPVLLKAFFVAREEMSQTKSSFLDATLKDLVEGIDFIEKTTELTHVSRISWRS